jgi:alanine racemase
MSFLKFLKKIRQNFINYEPAVKIFIFKENLINNLKEYQKNFPQLLFAPVLKSNAYGHGIVEVAKILEKENIPFFVVDSLPEAVILRNNRIKSAIQIIGYLTAENIKKAKISKTAFTITSLEQLKALSKIISKKIDLHLKIDTGMHRQGILINEINQAIEILKSNKFLNLVGICSHFADADNTYDKFSKLQIKKWNDVALIFKKEFPQIKYFHISQTAGVFYSNEIFGNVCRLGIGLYGINTSPFLKLNLKPVLQMETIISSIKKIKAGEFVGYNLTYKAPHDLLMATVPVGYFEGVDRRLSNCGFFKIKNQYCPIIGKVSMNITCIDVSLVPDIKLNDSVIIISSNKEDKNSAENLAKIIQTIPYEILVHIPQNLRRIVV